MTTTCGCARCLGERGDEEGMRRMILCATCGNKRCPHATDHVHPCTGSNEPRQPGSSYAWSDSPFNVVLAEARAARGMSVKELASRMGCTAGFVRSYEDCAVNPTVRTLYLYARALGLKVTIDRAGVTIEDGDGGVLLRDWLPTLSGHQFEEDSAFA